METERCPFCGDEEVRESDRDYPHWRQFECGSLFLAEGNIDRSRRCIIAALTAENERLRELEKGIRRELGQTGGFIVPQSYDVKHVRFLNKERLRVEADLIIEIEEPPCP